MARTPSSLPDRSPLTPAVLHILLALADGARHGYGIAREVEELTDGEIRLGPGTLYGSLQRMVETGLIEPAESGRRADPDEARRRYYRPTSMGRRVLEHELQRLNRLLGHARRKHLIRAPGTA